MSDTTITLTDGLTLSRVVPGMMRLQEWDLSTQELLAWIEQCIEMGATTFDHADIYGSYENEALFGEALTLQPSLRDKLQLVTKCGIQLLSENRPETVVKHYDTTYAHIIASAERSLRNLQTHTLDLLLIHRPDPLMNADAVARAFDDLRESGKVQHVGVSNFTPSQFDLLQSRLDYPLLTNQVEFSVSHLDPLHDGTFDHLQQQRVHPMAWSPLGGGAIFNPDTSDEHRLSMTMHDIADAHDARLDQIALAFILAHPAGIMPVLGTGKLERIEAAVQAVDITLTRQEWFRIWEASTGHDVP